MSKIVKTMNVAITEEYFEEFKNELKKGYVRVPLETSEGIIYLELTEVAQCNHTTRMGDDVMRCGKIAEHGGQCGSWEFVEPEEVAAVSV